jgi:hypothetical protein
MLFSSALIADLRGGRDAFARWESQKNDAKEMNEWITAETAKRRYPPFFMMPAPRQLARTQLDAQRMSIMEQYGSGIPSMDGESIAQSPAWVFAQQVNLCEVACRWFRFIRECSETPVSAAGASGGFYWAKSPLMALSFGPSWEQMEAMSL